MKHTEEKNGMENVSKIYPELERGKNGFQKYNEQILKEILLQNKETGIGRRYDFSSVRNEEEYAERVPVSRYSDYEESVRRMAEGEEGLITSGEVYCFLETSGSTEEGKKIPITVDSLKRYGDVMDRYLRISTEEEEGKRFFLSYLGTDLRQPLDPKDTLIFTSAYYRYLAEQGLFDTEKAAGGEVLNFFPGPCEYLYAKLWLAFLHADLLTMESIYLYDLLIFFQYMEMHFREVLEDMERGTIPKEKGLPEQVCRALLSVRPDPRRLKQVKEACEEGFSGIVNRLWKKVRLISGIGSKAFQVEEISIRKYTGDLPVWHYIYAASECVIAVPKETDSYDYILYPGGAYFEFLEEGEEEKTIPASLLVPGKCYEPVITTFSGLYRYAMGDILRMAGYYGELPVFRFLYRKNLVMNIAGEKTDMRKLDRAVRHWAAEIGAEVWQYYFTEDYNRSPAGYHGVIAGNGDAPGKKQEMSVTFDRILQGLNRDYEELRHLGSIGPAELEWMDRDRFMELTAGNLPKEGQAKPQHIRRGEQEWR